MDIPFVVTPDGLERLRGELMAAAGHLDGVGGRVQASATSPDWQGVGERAYAEQASALAAQCRSAADRLGSDARRVAGLEERLVAELQVLRRLEYEVADALSRLAVAAARDVSGTLRATLGALRDQLPLSGSPLWHGVATRVLALAP